MSDDNVSDQVGTSDPGLEPQVAEVRDGSRRMVRELGILSRTPLDGELSLSQCHILLELDRRGRLTPAELVETLMLDKSTTSRAVAPLVRHGLVRVVEDDADRRRRPVELLPDGRARVATIHRVASARVRRALELLEPSQRETVASGMRLYAAALERSRRLAELKLRPIEPADDPDLERLIRTVMTEFGAVGCGYSIEDDEVRAMFAEYSQPRHAYFVLERGGSVIGGGGIAPLLHGDEDTCELRKMYFYPELRGIGAGARLLDVCLDAARRLGYRRCYLETLGHMHQAQRLYEKGGFRRVDAPLGSTGHTACDRFYVLDLAAPITRDGAG